MKKGDIVELLESNPPFYMRGDRAKLVRQEPGLNIWWVYLEISKGHADGIWCVASRKVRLVEEVPVKSKALVPIDDWAEDHPLFLLNIDSAIRNLTGLRGTEAYRLRRMIMIFAREEFDNLLPN